MLRYNILSAGLYRYNVLVDTARIIWHTTSINTALEGIMGLKLEVGKYYKTRDGRKSPMITRIRDDGVAYFDERFDDQTCAHPNGRISFNGHKECGGDLIALWQDAPTGPVRTVTRKEIVPGVYNRLGVGEQSGDCIWVGLVENDGDYDLGSLLNASQLRALAVTLTEIADALEDQ